MKNTLERLLTAIDGNAIVSVSSETVQNKCLLLIYYTYCYIMVLLCNIG